MIIFRSISVNASTKNSMVNNLMLTFLVSVNILTGKKMTYFS